MANGHGGRRPGAGGRERDPAAKARAVELIMTGECANAQEAAEHPDVKGRIGWRQIQEARKAAERAAEGALVTSGPQPIPAGLSAHAADLWLVDEEIAATRRSLHEARESGNLARISPLTEQLRKLRAERRELRPPDPPSKENEEERWRAAAAAAVAKIERGVREVEGSPACRKCGTACPACSAGLTVAATA